MSREIRMTSIFSKNIFPTIFFPSEFRAYGRKESLRPQEKVNKPLLTQMSKKVPLFVSNFVVFSGAP